MKRYLLILRNLNKLHRAKDGSELKSALIKLNSFENYFLIFILKLKVTILLLLNRFLKLLILNNIDKFTLLTLTALFLVLLSLVLI
jgi:hypothetical protein